METKITFTSRIRFNGVEYKSPADMPPDIRALYDKAMAAVQGAGGGSTAGFSVQSASKIFFNGKEYANPDEMPPEARALYERVMAGPARTS